MSELNTSDCSGAVTATCPKCQHRGVVDTSPHVYFKIGRIAHRCRRCMHVWEARPTDQQSGSAAAQGES